VGHAWRGEDAGGAVFDGGADAEPFFVVGAVSEFVAAVGGVDEVGADDGGFAAAGFEADLDEVVLFT
jgi:hypothetical protein